MNITFAPSAVKGDQISIKQFRQLTGIFFILGAVLVNIPYILLIVNFDYPDILRAPVDQILTQF